MAEEIQTVSATHDAGEDYVAERAQAIARDNDPDAWFDSLANEQQPDPEGAAPPGADVAEDKPDAKAGPMPDAMVSWIGATVAPAARLIDFQRRATGVAGRAAKDLGRGAVETPGAVARGATSAVNNTAATVGALADWAYASMPDALKGGALDLTAKIRESDPDFTPGQAAVRLPQLFDERESTSGKVVEFASQWLTSQAIMGKVTKAFGMKPGAYKRIVDAAAAGGVGFDPNEPRLSNMINEATGDPITEFLKADPDDPEALARFKAALETGGLQVISEGVTLGFKALKEHMRAAKAAQPEARGAGALAQTAPQADDATQPVIQLKADNDNFGKNAVAFLKGEIPDSPIQVNLDRFDGPDAIKKAIGELSQLLPEEKVIPMETTLAQARAMGFDPKQAGTIFDRRQIAAGWMMFRSASGDLVTLAEKARATGAPADLARFNAAFQATHGILQTVKGQSAEIARALQIHNALRRSEPEMVKALQSMLDESGGAVVSLEMAEKVAMLKDPAMVGKFVQEAAKATTRDQITYAWSNVLLSNPTSHVANIGDTSIATVLQVPETWFASKFGADVAAGEATAKLYGIVQGMKDGIKLAARTMRTGESSFTAPGSRVEIMANRPLATSQDLVRGGIARQAGDYLKMLIPTRVMQAGDELTKAMNYRGEMHALAWREAVVKQGLEGKEAAAFASRLMSEAPEWLTKAAEAQAIKGTFNEPLTGFAASIAQAVDKANIGPLPVGRIIVPFVRTPTNLIRWTFHRTPAAFLSPKIQAEIAAGGATRDMALGRIAVGSTIMATTADFVLAGQITGAGPKDPERRAALMRTGWQPYSIKVGDQWVAYGRSGTFGSLMGIAADAVELLGGVYEKPKETITFEGEPVEDSVAAAAVFPFAQAVTSKTYMQGLANLMDALSDPARYGEGYVNRLVSSFVPAGVGAVERTIDPEIRRAKDWLDAVKARTPGYSDSLPPRLNLWGEPIKDENGVYNLFLPVRVSEVKGTPIDQAILDLRLEISPPKQVQSFSRGGISQNIELSPEQHNRLIELAGNELKLAVPGVAKPIGAKDYLNAIIEGKAGQISQRWEKGSDDLREMIVRDVLTRYRSAAKMTLMQEDEGLAALIGQTVREKADQIRTPRSGGLMLPNQ